MSFLRVLPVAVGLFFGATSYCQLYPELHAYENCSLDDGLITVEVSGLGPGVRARPVQTRKGTFPLPLLAGRRVMFAYPNTDFYANVKVEILPAEHYEEEKQLAVDGFDYTLASSSETTRNYALRPTLNDFSVQGLDRSKLEGGTLGIYLLFDDKARMLTTIYFLNADPERRKFSNMTDYAKLRDHFLSGYTSCIRRAQQTTTP